MMDMTGKVVLITGASRGIGAETARVFAEAGAKLGLLARSNDAVEALAAELGDVALPLVCDIADPAAVSAAVDRLVVQFGRLDVLINNAGVIEPINRIEHADPAGWGQAIDINLKGVFYGIHAALPHLRAAGGGSVLTVSSGAAHSPIEGWSHYCASKAGAAMLTRSLHLEEGETGIRAMGLSPGTVATQMQREIKASGINPVSELDWEVHIPPDWPARCLLWMCSPDADMFVGDEISLRDEALRARVGLA